MILQEDYITYETAILAKAKGFDVDCKQVYCKDKTIKIAPEEDEWAYQNSNHHMGICSRPTQALLQKWLRQRNIHVFVMPNIYTGFYDILIKDSFYFNEVFINTTPYHEVLEQALKRALAYVVKDKVSKYVIKEYYIKALEVAGPIKDGDLFVFTAYSHIIIRCDEFTSEELINSIDDEKIRVELFLCDPIVTVGDDVSEYHNFKHYRDFKVTRIYIVEDMMGEQTTMVADEQEAVNLPYVFNIVGKIPKDALYLKEGAILSEDKIQLSDKSSYIIFK